MSREGRSGLAAGRKALARQDWATAYGVLSEIDHVHLSPDELDGLGEAAWALGKIDASITAWGARPRWVRGHRRPA